MINSNHLLRSAFLFAIILCFSFSKELEAQSAIAEVAFSHSGGFYEEGFDLKLSHPDPDVTIYYSLDGSEPHPDYLAGGSYAYMPVYRQSNRSLVERQYQSFEYDTQEPITITDSGNSENHLSHTMTSFENNSSPGHYPNQSMVRGQTVRAVAIYDDERVSPITTHTYFITSDGVNPYALPVIALGIQEKDFFDYETGIYVPGKIYDDQNPNRTDGVAHANYSQRGIEWERRVSFEYFNYASSNAQLHHDIGVRIHGGWSRSFPLKSLRLYARSDYGENRFRFPFFPDLDDAVFNRLILRASGNDWNYTYFRDAMMQRIVGHLNVDTQAYQPVMVFLNGEFWGIHNMRERYDKHYLERVHDADPDNIDLLTENATAKEGDNEHYLAMMEFVKNQDLSDSTNYRELQTMMDTENYIDYLLANIFVGNSDWPGNNIDYWRARTDSFEPEKGELDGRWRWLIFDLDFGFYLYGQGPDYNSLRHTLGLLRHAHGNPTWSTELFRNLMENEEFYWQFFSRMMDQLNTAFKPNITVSIIQEMADYIAPEMPFHIERWSEPSGGFSGWQGRVDNELIYFARERPDFVKNHIRSHVGGQFHPLIVDVSDPEVAEITVNTIALDQSTKGLHHQPFPWEGSYLSSLPVRLKANSSDDDIPFSYWEVQGDVVTDKEIDVIIDERTFIRAVYNQDPPDPVSTPDEMNNPDQLELQQNFPNPFNPSTNIQYSIPESGFVQLHVYDVTGRRIDQLVDEYQSAGTHSISFDASGLASGVYLYRLEINSSQLQRVMTVVK